MSSLSYNVISDPILSRTVQRVLLTLLLVQKTIDDLLPVFAIEGGQLILKDGRVAMGFLIEPQEMERMPASGYQSLTEYLAGASRILPVGTTVQKLDFYYYKPFQVNPGDKSFFERSFINHFYNRLVLEHKSYLFLSLGQTKQADPNPMNTLFAWGKPFLMNNPFDGVEERMESLPGLARSSPGYWLLPALTPRL